MREYDHIPRPNIEAHYHIKELIERQEKRSDDRTYHRNKEKERQERNDLIKDANMAEMKDFYCSKCNEDFKSPAIKQVQIDWSCSTQNIAFYKTKCKCKKWCIRLITDKYMDGYWIKSRAIRADQGKYYNDILQPHQTGYNLLYGRQQ